MNEEIDGNVETARKSKTQYMNQIFSLQEEILKYKTNENKKEEKKKKGKKGKKNDELSRIKTADNNDNSINNISLNSFKEQLDDKNEFKNQVADLQNKNNLLEIIFIL